MVDGQRVKLTDPAEIAEYRRGYADSDEGPRGGKQYDEAVGSAPSDAEVNAKLREVIAEAKDLIYTAQSLIGSDRLGMFSHQDLEQILAHVQEAHTTLMQ